MKPILKLLLLSVLPIFAFGMLGMSQTELQRVETDVDVLPIDARSPADIWKEECASCHGIDGKGNTKAGKRAGVKDFTDAAYQKSWTDEEAAKVISTASKDGKQLKNKKPWAERLSPAEIKQMVSYVRQFAQ